MLQFSRFLQECPVCGRPAEVQRKYVGQRVVCQHCRGDFVAAEPRHGRFLLADRGGRFLGQVTHLLEMLNSRPAHSQT